MFGQFVKMNTALSSGSETLPSDTITNPKEALKGITTQSGNAYQGPMIPTTSSSLPKVVERETEVTMDMVPPTNNESTKVVQPLVVQIETPIPNSEPVVAPVAKPLAAPVSASMPNSKPSIPYPSRLRDQKFRDKANDQKEKIFQIFKYLYFNISFADALILMPKFGPTIKRLLTKKDKLYELARTPLNKHCSVVLLKNLPEKLRDPGKFLIPCDFPGMDECLALANLGTSINLMPIPRSFLKTEKALLDVYEGELTLRVGKEAVTFNLDQTSRYSANYNDMTANQIDVIDMACEEYSEEVLEEVDAFLALEDDPTSPEVDHSYYDTEGDILLLEAFFNDDPSLPPPTQGMYLPQGDDKLPVIIAKYLSLEEKAALIKVLKLYKQAIAWKLSDIKGIKPEFCTHKILMEDDLTSGSASKKGQSKNPQARPMTRLLKKDTPFFFFKECVEAFQTLKKKLTEAPILITPDCDLPFELMCDASDFAIGAVLGQRHEKHFRPIHYASKIMIEAESHYTTTEKEMLAVVYAFEKFQSYLILNKSIMYTDHSTLKYLFAKEDSKAKLLRWILLLQEFKFKSSGGVFMARKPLTFSRLAIMDPSRDIMARTTPPKRCLTPDFIGPQSTMMPMTWSNFVTLVNVREIFCNRMKCLKIPSKFTIFLMFEALISWGHSCLHEGTSIYSWPSITCRNRFGTPHAIISDRGTYFCNDQFTKVMLKLKIFSSKLKTRWSGPFTITQVFPYGTVELSQTDGSNFKVNGHRLKHYFGEDIPKMVVSDLQTFLKDQ
nr:reverse transcriptase domain-containing protein [Tanacetum cinerariifolium]